MKPVPQSDMFAERAVAGLLQLFEAISINARTEKPTPSSKRIVQKVRTHDNESEWN